MEPARAEAKVDRFGRVVIPKRLRDELGLEPGTRFVLTSSRDELHLKPVPGEPPLVRRGGVLVFGGEPSGDVEGQLARVREARTLRGSSRK